MKKIFVFLTVLFALSFVACGDDGNGDAGKTAVLIIRNASAFDFSDVVYASTSYGSINAGQEKELKVTAGVTSPIAFSFTDLAHLADRLGVGIRCTTDTFICNEDEDRLIVINNDTVVTTTSDGLVGTVESVFMTLSVQW
jgi:hypothetical protein